MNLKGHVQRNLRKIILIHRVFFAPFAPSREKLAGNITVLQLSRSSFVTIAYLFRHKEALRQYTEWSASEN